MATKSGTTKSGATYSAKVTPSAKSLANKLSGVAAQAKSLGINTSKADAMVAQTKAEGRKSFSGSSYEKDYMAGKYGKVEASPIATTDLNPTTPVNLPKQEPTTPVPSIESMNAALGITDQTETTNTTQKDTTTGTTTPDNYQSMFDWANKKLVEAYQASGTQADRWDNAYKQSGWKQAEKERNKWRNQLSAVITQRDQDMAAVEGQGRGIPEPIILGQQYQINKEAYMKAAPIQAGLAAAQEDYDSAKEMANKMYEIETQDAINKYNFNVKVIESVYNYATAAETRRLDEVRRQQDIALQSKQNNSSQKNNWAQTAFANGQSTLGGKIMALKTDSPTFEQDLAALTGQLRKPETTTSTQDWDFKEINGVLYKVNKRTGEIVPADTGSATPGVDKTSMRIDKYDALLNDIGVATSLADSGVGAGWLERGWKSLWSSNPDFAQLETISDTVKTNLLALSDNPALKKFFAAPMSDTDTRLLLGAETTLNPNTQTPTEFKKDLQAAADLFARAREAERQSIGQELQMSVYPGNITYTPDGQEVIIID